MFKMKQGSRRDGELQHERRAAFAAKREKIRELRAKIDALPEIRAERVAELRHAIHNHAFQVSAAALADAILRELGRSESA